MSTKTGSRGVYGRFADVYDQIGMDRFSTKMVAYSLELMRRHKIRPRRVLDLCCGTGTAAKLFAEHGYSVVGVDQSAAMLKVAREKCHRFDARFYRSTLPKLELPDRAIGTGFDLVTSYYDALNYLLTERELLATFRAAHTRTVPGGWLIFDMNTLAGLGRWQNSTGATDDLAWAWRAEFDAKRKLGILRAAFFVRQGKYWKRFDETHCERGYTPAEIQRLVRRAGFVIRGVYDCRTFGKAPADAGRICVVAQKRG